MRLPLVAFSKVAAGEVSVNGGMTAVSSAGRVEQQQLWARGGELDGRSRSMTIGIANIRASLLCSDNIISSICQTTSSVVPIVGSNAFVPRHNIHTRAEDQSLGLEGRGTAGRTPPGTKKNHWSQRTHRWGPHPSVRDAE